MFILGVSCYYHDSAAVLLKEGQLVAAAEEERFSRVRDDYRWHIALRHPDPASIVRELPLGVQWRIDIDPVNTL